MRIPRAKTWLFLMLVSLSSTLFSQPNSNFEPGEIVLNNASVLKGYIWIADRSSNVRVVYYKHNPKDPLTEYSVSDLVTISLSYGRELIASEALPTPDGMERKLVKVVFDGTYDLLSLNEDGKIHYYIKNSLGEITELINSFTIPGPADNYKIQFGYEYRKILHNLFDDDVQTSKLIESTAFTAESLSKLLKKYHVSNKLDYKIYPPPFFTMSVAAGGSAYLIQQSSDIYNSVSTSPFAGAIVSLGFSALNDHVEIRIESGVLYGIIYHDITTELNPNVTGYYEDISNVSLLTNSINLYFSPFRFGKFIPNAGIGISYNNYLTFNEKLTEELFDSSTNTVSTNFFDNDLKPKPFIGVSCKAGVTYSLDRSNYLRLTFNYSRFPGNSSKMISHTGMNISFIHNIF